MIIRMAYTENNLDEIIKRNPITDKVIEEFEAIDSVEKTKTRRYLTFAEDGIKRDVAIFDEKALKMNLKNQE